MGIRSEVGRHLTPHSWGRTVPWEAVHQIFSVPGDAHEFRQPKSLRSHLRLEPRGTWPPRTSGQRLSAGLTSTWPERSRLFVALEAAVFTLVPMETLAGLMQSLFASRWSWLIVLGAFMGVSWLAQSWANSNTSQAMQYLGLLLYVVAEAVIFVPILFVANNMAPAAIPAAGVLSLVVFGGLTGLVFVTRSDLSSWGKYLWCAGWRPWESSSPRCCSIFSWASGSAGR